MTEAYIRYITYERRLSPNTLEAYRQDLEQFASYLSECEFDIDPPSADFQSIRGWIIFLLESGIGARSINRKLAALNGFYRFLKKQDYRKDNPCAKLTALKTPKRLPDFLREIEIEQSLEQERFPETLEGMRDGLVLEVLYGTGIRLSELIGLKDSDINLHSLQIKVLGKGNKERIVPITDRLAAQIKSFIEEKKKLGISKASPYLFVTNKGEQTYPMLIWRIVNKHVLRANARPHLLRHTYATHLLDHGADINAIKDLLGHANLAATQVYTHTSLEKLRETFKKAHPKA